MELNYYEETLIKNSQLPDVWQSQRSLDELLEFLQFNWEQRSVFYDDGEVTSRQQFLTFTGQKGVRTRKYIGTIVFKGQQLNIFPKVFRTDIDDTDTSELSLKHLMLNLVQWLQYCDTMNYPFIHMTSELDDSSDLKELFVTLYVRYVKNAIDRGLFYRYEEETEESSVIRGHLDLKDYFTRKYPAGKHNKFLCTYSNFEVDNALNRIIKYTCKFLLKDASKANQKTIRHILVKLNEVSDVRCSPIDCDNLILSRLHKHYSVVLSMSKMFLLNKTASYRLDDSESFCFLFPTDLLFEGFVGGFLKDIMQNKARVRLQASELTLINDIEYAGQSLGKAFTMKHDILLEHREHGMFILDTKYKQLKRFEGSKDLKKSITDEVKQEDLYQVIEYASHRCLSDVYLLYPLYRHECVEPHNPVLLRDTVAGNQKIRIHLVRLPFVFEEDTEDTKRKLTTVLNNLFPS